MSARAPRIRAEAEEEAERGILAELIRRSGGEDGQLTFAVFMEVVLYHPRWGYYGRPKVFGRGGDFQTAPRVHPIFGQAVARAVLEEWERQQRPQHFTLLELGPGEGHLAASVVKELAGPLGVDLSSWKLVLVDRFTRKESSVPFDPSLRPVFCHSLHGLGKIRGTVLANEVFDALPFHILHRGANGWRERYVAVTAGEPQPKAHWVEGALSDDDLARHLPDDIPEGVVAEVCPNARALLSELATVLEEGSVLIFDYGDTRADILRSRPEGTLETFRRHQAGIDPLQHLGSTDLGAWVDFTRLGAYATEAGFQVEGLQSQAETLHEWGLEEIVRREEGKGGMGGVQARLALKTFYFSYPHHKVLRLRMARRVRAAPRAARSR